MHFLVFVPLVTLDFIDKANTLFSKQVRISAFKLNRNGRHEKFDMNPFQKRTKSLLSAEVQVLSLKPRTFRSYSEIIKGSACLAL